MATLAGWLRPLPFPSPPGLIGVAVVDVDDFAEVVGVVPVGIVVETTTSVVVTEFVGVTVTTVVDVVGGGAEVVGGVVELGVDDVEEGLVDVDVVGGGEVDELVVGGGGGGLEDVVGGGDDVDDCGLDVVFGGGDDGELVCPGELPCPPVWLPEPRLESDMLEARIFNSWICLWFIVLVS